MAERVSAKEAWHALETNPQAVLIDVRTPEEWRVTGVPDLSAMARDVVLLTWNPYDAGAFAAALQRHVPDRQTPVYFICRSGARSQMTADLAEHLTYETSVNVVEGFEGPPDDTGRRGTVCGWQAENLPIRQV